MAEGSKVPLNIFDLPQELLDTFFIRSIASQAPSDPAANRTDDEEITSSLGCNVCRISSLHSVADQRNHFRSDWHRYNIAQRRKKLPAVTEEAFEGIVDNLEGSISGSESDSSTESSESSLTNSVSGIDLGDGSTPTSSRQKSPMMWYSSTTVPDTQYGLYRVALPSSADFLKTLKQSQIMPISSSKLPTPPSPFAKPTQPEAKSWAIFMIGGGHFAGSIISLVPKINKVSGRFERDVIVLEHKTVHRYTTRRKQGGSQSLNDQSKGKAKSAGAQIRRYNEAALQDDVRNTLQSWKDQLGSVDAIFMRSSKANSKIFFNYDDAPFARYDSRLHTIPFPTRRPTLAEVRRVFEELTRVKLSYLTEDALKRMDDDYAAAQARKVPKVPLKSTMKPEEKAIPSPRLTPAERLTRKRWDRLIEMVVRGRLDALISFVEKRQDEGDSVAGWTDLLPEWTAESTASPSLLHLASSHGQAMVVRWLLLDCRSDPSITSATMPRTAYEVASTRATRNVFRRCMTDHPDWCNWQGQARVPSGLTEQQEEEQKDKGRERKSRLRERAKERKAEQDGEQARLDAERRAFEDALAKEKATADQARKEALPNKPQRLGGQGAKIARTIDNDAMAGLSAEAKMRIEREKRAKAAEARFKSPSTTAS